MTHLGYYGYYGYYGFSNGDYPQDHTVPAGTPFLIEGDLTVGTPVFGDISGKMNYLGIPFISPLYVPPAYAFYLFTPSESGLYTFSTCGSKFDTRLRIFETSDSSGTYSSDTVNQIKFADDIGCGYCGGWSSETQGDCFDE